MSKDIILRNDIRVSFVGIDNDELVVVLVVPDYVVDTVGD